MAKALVDDVMAKVGIEKYEITKTFEGSELEGMLCMHPFLERDSKVVLGSDDTIVVELGTGTGAVHTAPGYGKEDYLCGLKNGLDIVVTVDGKGYQREGAEAETEAEGEAEDDEKSDEKGKKKAKKEKKDKIGRAHV